MNEEEQEKMLEALITILWTMRMLMEKEDVKERLLVILDAIEKNRKEQNDK